MARSGSLAALEQRLAAQRREEDRLARERRQRERDQERVRQQEHLASRQQEAEEQTAAVEERMKALGEVLTGVLSQRPLTFERLLSTPRISAFDPGPLGPALPAPDWEDFAPVPAAGLGRLLGAGARQARQLTDAQARFEAARAEHQRQEAERRRALAVAKAKYDRKVTEERARAAARNSYVTSRQSAFAAGNPEAVDWFVGCVLRVAPYPDGFPREYQVAYDPGNRDVTVDLEFPSRSVVPAVRAYRYVKARDAVEPVPRQESEITQAHERLVACVALRALHEIFCAIPAELVQVVTLTGWVSSVDRATGARVRSRLLAMRAERPVFDALVLDAVDPIACLDHLNTPPALAFGVAFGGLEGIHQRAEGRQVQAGLLKQGRQLGGAELAGRAVSPVLRGLGPGVVEQPELLVAVLVWSGNHDQEAGARTRRAASRLAMMATRCSSIRGSSFSSRSANRPAMPPNSLASASIRCCQRRIASSRSPHCSTVRA
jgi:hypothetical protein